MTNKSKKSNIDNTGERMVPEYSAGSLMYSEHMVRYKAALEFVSGKTVLDIASGSGYGTKIIASKAAKVFGVEVDEASILYSKENFGSNNIKYIKGDASTIPLDDNSVDVVVSFETIEHIKDYNKFLDEVDRVLKDDGVLLLSTPNSLEFTEGNHFHLHEFEYEELVNLVSPKFKYIDSYFQGTWKGTAIATKDFIEEISSKTVLLDNYAPLVPEQYLYFFLVCSKKPIVKKIKVIAGLGEHYSDKTVTEVWAESNAHISNIRKEAEINTDHLKSEISQLKNELNAIKNSKSYILAQKMAKAYNKVTKF